MVSKITKHKKTQPHNYVALDIETSSLDPEEGEILEIGLAKFDERGKKLDELATLIKNKKEVPALALAITGIKEKDLLKAPFLEEIKEKFQEFIKDSIIVGHNVNFDIKYLKKNNLKLENPVIDTWHLATILLPTLPSHSLEVLTSKLKINHLEKHRALDDAKASFALFLFLKEKIKEIEPKTRAEIQKYLKKNKSALASLFAIKGYKLARQAGAPAARRTAPIDFSELKKVLAVEKPAKKIKAELNANEIKIIQEISNALLKNTNLILEVPAGIKKNLIYLLAAGYFLKSPVPERSEWYRAKKLKKKILLVLPPFSWQYISQKVVPALKNILPFPLKISFFDKRENYFCLYRFDKYKEKKKFDHKELILLTKLLLWEKESADKKISEVPAFFEERKILDKLTARRPFCLEKKCKYFKNKECPYYKAFWKTKRADIVIIPPALLFAKNQNGFSVKGESLIIDKAEILDDTALFSFTYQVSDAEIIDTLDDIKNFLKSIKKADKFQKGVYPFIKDFDARINQIKNQVITLFGLIGIFLKKTAIDQIPTLIELLIKERHRETFDFKKIKDALPHLISNLENIENGLLSLKEKGAILLNHDLSAYSLILKNICLKLENIILKPKESETYWATFRGKEITLFASPNDFKRMNKLTKESAPLILVSEAIFLKDGFAYAKEKLFLKEKFKEVSIPPSLKETEKILTVVVKDFSVSPSLFIEEIANLILKIAPLLKEKVAIALPSISAIQNIFERVSEKLKDQNINLIAQRISGGKLKTIEQFKNSRKAIFLATYDFLEKVRFPKKRLNGIIITRLPFEAKYRPKDQLKMEEKDAFARHILPKALLKMKVLFNLVLKSKGKKKFFLILDDRVSSKDYGTAFISILPSQKITWLKKEEIERTLKKYLREVSEKS